MPVVTSSQSIKDALHTATALLSRSVESARLDAELLLSHVTGLSRTDFHTAPERELPPQAGWSFQQLVKRRLHGEPVAYIIGEQGFWSLLLEVSPAVLVPRPETERLVECALTHLAPDATLDVLDLGTGSGAIALAIASERPAARVVAAELSGEALHIATRNAARLQLANVRFVQGAWFEPLRGRRFDLIASNPPYIAAGDPDLQVNVRRHEPELALIAGPSGLEALERIIEHAPTHLESGGWLVLEHGWKQGAAVRALMERQGFSAVRTWPDLAGRERITEGCAR